jgi:hypothetical protein
MNIDQLKEGLVVKDYKELCVLVGEKVKEGNAKKAQLKEIERFVRVKKFGHKFKILEVYQVPLMKTDKRINKGNDLYQMHIQLLLLDYLAQQASNDNFHIMELTNMDILRITKMCNEYYLSKELDTDLCNIVSKFHLRDFYRATGQKFCKLINSSLLNLKNRCILNIKEKYKFKVVCDEKVVWYIADEEEEALIIAAKYQALALMGLQTELQVQMKFKTKEFYNKVNTILDAEYDWKGCYKYYQISFHQDEIMRKIIRHRQEAIELYNQQIALNNKVVDYFNDSIVDRYNQNLKHLRALEDKLLYADTKEIEEMVLQEFNQKFILNKNFVPDNKLLVQYLIQI